MPSIRCLFALVALTLIPPGVCSQEKKPRIDPAGIPGALILNGAGPADAAVERFLALAGGPKAKLVLIVEEAKAAEGLLGKVEASKASFVVLPLSKLTALVPDFSATATGVWIAGAMPTEHLDVLRDVCARVARRGGVIATSGAATAQASEPLRLLPDARIDIGRKVADRRSGIVAYEIEPGAALLVQGRLLSALGGGKVTVRLPASGTLPERTVVLEGKRFEDLTALRRAARARAEKAALPEAPVVAKGTLVIVGGGGSPKGLIARFVELAGGAKAIIVVLPTANPDPLPEKDAMVDALRKAGAEVIVLKGRTLAEVDSPESLQALARATGIWFGGGRQWRFVDAYEGTKALEAMKDVLRRGGMIGGSSAGATIQGDYLCRGSPFDNFALAYEGYERGLGFLPGVAIDQHFTQRKRHKEMTAFMATHPQYLGIGIDEATALIVQGQVAEIMGKGKVHFYDARRAHKEGEADYEAVGAGERYDLKMRRVLE